MRTSFGLSLACIAILLLAAPLAAAGPAAQVEASAQGPLPPPDPFTTTPGLDPKRVPGTVESTPIEIDEITTEPSLRVLREGANPLIQEIVDRINKVDVMDQFTTLQDTYSKPNRLTGSSNYRRATDWLKGVFEANAPHVWVEYHEFTQGSATFRNVIFWQNGSDPGAGIYMVGGHYDSVAAGPGMDDDGSGSLGAALIGLSMVNYKFKATVAYALWDAEESGLIGSDKWAKEAKAKGVDLRAFINMDMIGYDPNLVNKFTTTGGTDAQPIKDLHAVANQQYNIGLAGVSQAGQQGCASDHCSFDRQGFVDLFNVEPKFSDHWHLPSDTNSNMNFDTLTRTLKVTAAVLAEISGIEGKQNLTTATKLDVIPKNATIDLSKSLQYRAKGYDANGTPAPLPAPVTWSASSGVVSQAGLYTPAAVGNHTITATSGNLTASTVIQVTPAVLSRVEIQPRDPVIREDQTVAFKATGYDGVGQPVDPQPVFTWNVTPKGEISTEGVFTPDGPGFYTVTAQAGVYKDSTNVEVRSIALSKLDISITDSDCKVIAGGYECDVTAEGIQFFAKAWDDAGTELNWDPINDGAKVAWNVTPPGFGVVRQDWVFSTDNLGSIKVRATAYGRPSDNQLNVSLVPGELKSLALMPDAPQKVEAGKTVQFTFNASDSKGNALPASRLSVKYSLNPAEIGTVDDKGLFKGSKKGFGKLLLEATDTKHNSKLSDDTNIEVTESSVPPPPPPPPSPMAGLLVPIAAAVALAALAAVAILLMRRKRKDAVKEEVKAPGADAKAAEPSPVREASKEAEVSRK
jgi:hypothetical protein